VDPWEALNPYSMWLQVLLISGLSLVGYAATRWLGRDKGIAVTGLAGGLVSSTSVTLTFVHQSRHRASDAAHHALAGGIILAWCIMFARVIVEVLVVNRALVASIILPFAAMEVVALVFAGIYLRGVTRLADTAAREADVPIRNPFSLTAASKFAVFFAVVMLVVKVAQRELPASGIYVVAALAGLTDVDAIALSMAESARTSDPAVAAHAIVLAAVTAVLATGVLAIAIL
jgi:uncharacterized membrane protein (DUF4010 family)